MAAHASASGSAAWAAVFAPPRGAFDARPPDAEPELTELLGDADRQPPRSTYRAQSPTRHPGVRPARRDVGNHLAYVHTDGGWLYVARVLDRHTRRCVA